MRCYLISESQAHTHVYASSMAVAIQHAKEWVLGAYDQTDRTYWVNVTVTDTVTGERADLKVAIDPTEPPCIHPRTLQKWPAHDWRSEHRVVGGIPENPGVWGHGGGVTITAACHRCGCGRTIDTWAQDPEDGRQGLRAVIYRPGAYLEEIERESDGTLRE